MAEHLWFIIEWRLTMNAFRRQIYFLWVFFPCTIEKYCYKRHKNISHKKHFITFCGQMLLTASLKNPNLKSFQRMNIYTIKNQINPLIKPTVRVTSTEHHLYKPHRVVHTRKIWSIDLSLVESINFAPSAEWWSNNRKSFNFDL